MALSTKPQQLQAIQHDPAQIAPEGSTEDRSFHQTVLLEKVQFIPEEARSLSTTMLDIHTMQPRRTAV